MLKISYAGSPSQSPVISAQFALELCAAVQNHQKIQKPYFNVQAHSRSLLLVLIGSQHMTSY